MQSLAQPAYMRIRQYLIQRIRTGSSGDGILSEKELCGLFGVTRPTVRAALKELTESGELVARKGVGVFIGDKRRWDTTGDIVGLVGGDGRNVFNAYTDSLELSGILAALPELGYVSIFLNRAENAAQFPPMVKSLNLKGIVWVQPDLELLRLFRAACPDLKLVVSGACADATRRDPTPHIVDGYAVMDVFQECLEVGRRCRAKGARRVVWLTPEIPLENDDFEAYSAGFAAAGPHVWLRKNRLDKKTLAGIFADGPVGVSAHQRFLVELDAFAREEGLVHGRDYFLFCRGTSVTTRHPEIAVDLIKYDYPAMGAAAARVLDGLLRGEPGLDPRIKLAPKILEPDNKQTRRL